MQVLRQVNEYQIIQNKDGEFNYFDGKFISLGFNQETKDKLIKLSDDDFLIDAAREIRGTVAIMMIEFFVNKNKFIW